MYSDDESHRKTTKFGTKASFLTPKTMKKTTVPWMKTNCIKTIFSILLKLNALKTLQKTQVRPKCLEPVLWNYKRSKKVRRNTCKWIKFVKNVYTSWENEWFTSLTRRLFAKINSISLLQYIITMFLLFIIYFIFLLKTSLNTVTNQPCSIKMFTNRKIAFH